MNICFISDFFYPNVGGIEGHMYQLSQRLIARGHKVRQIFIREQIDIVHGHGAFSSMSSEGLLHAGTMGLKTVFTDHSLFGFEDTSSILTNKLLKFALSDVNHVICVSHTARENTVLRASLVPTDVSVIPNAIVSKDFTPDLSKRSSSRTTIVVASRLVYRKGIDLLVSTIPAICENFPNVDFLIAGDGPKRIDVEQMREKFALQDRVQVLGSVPHREIRNFLVKGSIFLNTSLTEAFCISIVEAASCGLLVVSTKVGGVPEVLPDEMIIYAEPSKESIIGALVKALKMVPTIDPQVFHQRLTSVYSWFDIAQRTELVYARVLATESKSLSQRLSRYHNCGPYAGKIAALVMAIDYLIYFLLEWLVPRNSIDTAPRFDPHYFKQQLENNT